jgi:hypothetical protein
MIAAVAALTRRGISAVCGSSLKGAAWGHPGPRAHEGRGPNHRLARLLAQFVELWLSLEDFLGSLIRNIIPLAEASRYYHLQQTVRIFLHSLYLLARL